ncbi:hypothetical protein CmeUKMEL1_02955 [Cryptosporidium meleagridis]|uniref:Uncharacterized protein n=1 Tax=Cryptosporidium meleagridis TaxID=93969 RepID=A0A2P4YXK9_9CRYT|nr:hypothetical protein CmeUKMEL1_02955 [Cryptosporidium meleagridis]
MASFKYTFIFGFVLISIYLNIFNSATRNEKIKSIEFSFLNAQAPGYYTSEPRDFFSVALSSGLFLGKSKDGSYEEFLSKYGFYGRRDDLQPACTKEQIRGLLKEIKVVLYDYYVLLGKNYHFRKLSFTAALGSTEQLDVASYLRSTRPLFTKTEATLIILLSKLFKCILSRKIKKYYKNPTQDTSLLYSKSITSISKELLKILKSIESRLGEDYPRCLKTATGASLVECKALGESLSACQEHIQNQKDVKDGKYEHKMVLKSILKSPASKGSHPKSPLEKKHVRFVESVAGDV